MYAGFLVDRFRGQVGIPFGFRWQTSKSNACTSTYTQKNKSAICKMTRILLCPDAHLLHSHHYHHRMKLSGQSYSQQTQNRNTDCCLALYCGWLSTFDILQFNPEPKQKSINDYKGHCYCLDSLLIAKTTQLECPILLWTFWKICTPFYV